jgi:phosphatidylserine decarboxylase
LQYALPHHLLSALMHRATRLRLNAWKGWQMRWFIRRYAVDMSEAAEPDANRYPDFNAFFTRALRAGARPLGDEPGALSSPADGMLSEFGTIREDILVQAKGQHYTTTALLGGRSDLAARFEGGAFATVYLSPRDYHRVHMPLDGRLLEMVHVPGRLFSVSLATTRLVPSLFARNERVVSVFETGQGLMAVALGGAVFVGSIEQVWSGVVTPPRARAVTCTRYDGEDAPIALERGAEMGRFNMGSTVIVLLEAPGLRWRQGLAPGTPTRYGETLALI